MSLDPPKPRRWPRIAGIVLLAAGGACVYLFIQYPTGTLARFGFPKAWKGGPLVLGAAFCWINGCFLLFQRRFSLGAFVVSGVVAGALAAGALAYVSSIHERAVVVTQLAYSEGRLPGWERTVEPFRKLATADNLNALIDDACRDGWLPGTDFYTVAPMAGIDSNHVVLELTLTFDYSPYVHPERTGARGLVEQYCIFVHNWITDRQYGHNAKDTARALAGLGSKTWYRSTDYRLRQLLDALEEFRLGHGSKQMTSRADLRLHPAALKFLRDREPDPELKAFFSDVLTEYERLQKDSE